VALLALVLVLTAPRSVRPAAQFASGVKLVEVYASVSDRAGEPVLGLSAADFHIAEDGRPQRITTFAAGDFPLSLAVAVDRSFSMAGPRLAAAKAAGRAFVAALRPDDDVMLIAIGSETEVTAPLTRRHDAVATALERLAPWGTTPLYDSIRLAIDRIDPASGGRALVLLSDGEDRFSRTSAADVLDYARRHDVLLYPIAIGRARPTVFAELAAATGGQSFLVSDAKQLEATLQAIARELRFQYLLGYNVPREPAPGWHAIQVAVDRPGVRIRARDGYWGR
jgi:Ca-activated chloride channel family protein